MGETIRGAGLLKVEGILAALAENPEQLEHARGRFANTLRSNYSSPSHYSTRSQSSNPASEGQHDQDQQRWQLKEQYLASCPHRQFEDQKREELDRLYEADSNWTARQPPGVDFHQLAEENIKRKWESQGIWNENWEVTRESWRWKHEEPGPRIQTEATDATALFSRLHDEAKPTRTQSTPDARQRRQRQQRHQWSEGERDASRPFNQFIYQVFEERKQIHSVSGLDVTGSNADIYTKAYDAVRNVWVRRGIWDKRWGILPGMSWKHEQSLDDAIREELGAGSEPSQAVALDIGSRQVVETSPTCILGPVGSRANNDCEPHASGHTTESGGMPHENATILFDVDRRQPSEVHIEHGSLQRQRMESLYKRGRGVRLLRTRRSSVFAPDRFGARRKQELDQRQQQKSIGEDSAKTVSPPVPRRSKRLQEARNMTASQANNSGHRPRTVHSRRKTTRGRLQ